MQVYRGAFLALTAAIIQAGSHRKSINASLLIVHSLSEPPSQSAPSCVEDRDCNEDQGTVSLYPSHFLPCRLFKLRMMLLFVPRFIPGKMVDLAATNSVCGAGTVNTAARAVLQSDNWGEFKGRVWIKCLFGFFFYSDNWNTASEWQQTHDGGRSLNSPALVHLKSAQPMTHPL